MGQASAGRDVVSNFSQISLFFNAGANAAQRLFDLSARPPFGASNRVDRPLLNEETFDILISCTGPDKCRLEARSSLPIPPAISDIKIPSREEWKHRLASLQTALYFTSGQSCSYSPPTLREVSYHNAPVIRSETKSLPLSQPKIISEIGNDLYEILFAREIYNAFSFSQRNAQERSASLNVRLTFDSPGLSYLPWETIFDGRDFLALSPRSPVVRNTGFDADLTLPPAQFPIAVLGMVPQNNNFADASGLNVEAEQANIRLSLQPLVDEGRAVLHWTAGTPSDLIDRLRHPPDGCSSWHIFHFSGHGGFDDELKKGYLVVDPDPYPIGMTAGTHPTQSLYADDLKDVLDTTGDLRLIILNSCKGGMGNEGAASAAEELVTGGFPAVIAMQFDISDSAAIMFSATFYKYLADGEVIHRAVTLARQRMKRAGMSEWITPVLYMRGRDGRLFRH